MSAFDPKRTSEIFPAGRSKAGLVRHRIPFLILTRSPQEISDFSFQKFASSAVGEPPQGAKKFVYILADLTKRLSAMDRHERRALSRRKFAIRELDTALTSKNAEGGNSSACV